MPFVTCSNYDVFFLHLWYYFIYCGLCVDILTPKKIVRLLEGKYLHTCNRNKSDVYA